MIAMRRRQKIASARRFTLMGLVLAAVGLLFATSVTFTATSGQTDVSITKTETTIGDVHSQGIDALPVDGGALSALTGVGWPAAGASSTGTGTPSAWSPIEGQSVKVTTSGDIAVIDARGLAGNVFITLTLTNASDLAAAYSYFILPIEIEVFNNLNNGGSSWDAAVVADTANTISVQYLTLSNGFLTFLVDGGSIYGITIPLGGSIYTVNDQKQLSPTFQVTTRPA